MKTLIAVLIALGCNVGFVYAQQAAITNADIVKMVKAGLSEELVVATVQQAQNKTFDVSPSALISLKGSGVSDRIITAMVAGGAPTAGPVAAAGEVKVPDGTEVRLRLLDRLTSASAKVNDRVRFEAVENVMVDGKVVIAQGAQAVGTVFEANPKKSFGRSGKLNFTIDAVRAVDGDNIRLRSSKENKGDESFGKAGVVTILAGPFGALVRGKDVEIEAGTEYTIYIDGDRTIQLQAGL